mgnify:FL=1
MMFREGSESFLGMSMDEVKSEISNVGYEAFVSNLRGRVLSRKVAVHGRCVVDDRGAMVFADQMEVMEPKPAEEAEEVMQRWGVVL